jgi:hypothetical protein
VTKVQSASLHFFLGSEEEDDDSDEEEVGLSFTSSVLIPDSLLSHRTLTLEPFIINEKSTRRREVETRN